MKPENNSPNPQSHPHGSLQLKKSNPRKSTLADVFEKRQERLRVNVDEECQAILKTRSYKHKLQEILDAEKTMVAYRVNELVHSFDIDALDTEVPYLPREPRSDIIGLWNIPPRFLAEQLTYRDRELFSLIKIDELINVGCWSKRDLAPNITSISDHFNRLSFSVASEIITENELSFRRTKLEYAIETMEELLRLNNMQSLLAFHCSVTQPALARMKRTFVIRKSFQESMKRLDELVSPGSNYANLRNFVSRLEGKKVCCIPYLGLYLTDLITLQTKLSGAPMARQLEVYEEKIVQLRNLVSVPLKVIPDRFYQNFIRHLWFEDENSLFCISRELEPRKALNFLDEDNPKTKLKRKKSAAWLPSLASTGRDTQGRKEKIGFIERTRSKYFQEKNSSSDLTAAMKSNSNADQHGGVTIISNSNITTSTTIASPRSDLPNEANRDDSKITAITTTTGEANKTESQIENSTAHVQHREDEKTVTTETTTTTTTIEHQRPLSARETEAVPRGAGTLSASSGNLSDLIVSHASSQQQQQSSTRGQQSSSEEGREKDSSDGGATTQNASSNSNTNNKIDSGASSNQSVSSAASVGRLSPRGLSPRTRSEKASNDTRRRAEGRRNTEGGESSAPLAGTSSTSSNARKEKSSSPSRELPSSSSNNAIPAHMVNDPFIKHVRSVSVSTQKDSPNADNSQLLNLSPSKSNLTTSDGTTTAKEPATTPLRNAMTRKVSAPVLYHVSHGSNVSPRAARIQTTPRSPRTQANASGSNEKLTIAPNLTVPLTGFESNRASAITNSPPSSPARSPRPFVTATASNSGGATSSKDSNNLSSTDPTNRSGERPLSDSQHALQKAFSMPQLKWTNAVNSNPRARPSEESDSPREGVLEERLRSPKSHQAGHEPIVSPRSRDGGKDDLRNFAFVSSPRGEKPDEYGLAAFPRMPARNARNRKYSTPQSGEKILAGLWEEREITSNSSNNNSKDRGSRASVTTSSANVSSATNQQQSSSNNVDEIVGDEMFVTPSKHGSNPKPSCVMRLDFFTDPNESPSPNTNNTNDSPLSPTTENSSNIQANSSDALSLNLARAEIERERASSSAMSPRSQRLFRSRTDVRRSKAITFQSLIEFNMKSQQSQAAFYTDEELHGADYLATNQTILDAPISQPDESSTTTASTTTGPISNTVAVEELSTLQAIRNTDDGATEAVTPTDSKPSEDSSTDKQVASIVVTLAEGERLKFRSERTGSASSASVEMNRSRQGSVALPAVGKTRDRNRSRDMVGNFFQGNNENKRVYYSNDVRNGMAENESAKVERIHASNEREVKAQLAKLSRESTADGIETRSGGDAELEAKPENEQQQFDFRNLLAEENAYSNNSKIGSTEGTPLEYKPEIEVLLPSVNVLRIPSVFQTLGARGTSESPRAAGHAGRKNSGNTPHKRFFARATAEQLHLQQQQAVANGESESNLNASSPRRGRRVTNYFILKSSQLEFPQSGVDSSEGSEGEKETESANSANSETKNDVNLKKLLGKDDRELFETEEKVRLEMSKILSETDTLTVDGLEDSGEEKTNDAAITPDQRASLALMRDSSTKIIPLASESETVISAFLSPDGDLPLSYDNVGPTNIASSTTAGDTLIDVEFQGNVEDSAKAAQRKQQIQQQLKQQKESTTASSSTAPNRGSRVMTNSAKRATSNLSTSGKQSEGWTGWELTNKETTERKYRDCLTSKRNHYLTLPVVITGSIFAGTISRDVLCYDLPINTSDGVVFVHRFVLEVRCVKLWKLITLHFDDLVSYQMPYPSEIVDVFVTYLYLDVVDFYAITIVQIMDLWKLSLEFEVGHLSLLVYSFLRDSLTIVNLKQYYPYLLEAKLLLKKIKAFGDDMKLGTGFFSASDISNILDIKESDEFIPSFKDVGSYYDYCYQFITNRECFDDELVIANEAENDTKAFSNFQNLKEATQSGIECYNDLGVAFLTSPLAYSDSNTIQLSLSDNNAKSNNNTSVSGKSLPPIKAYIDRMSQAIWEGKSRAFLRLCESCPYYIFNQHNDRGQSLLYVAARKGDTEILKMMLTLLAKPSLANKLEILGLDKKNQVNGSTALHGAAFGNHPEAVAILLYLGARYDIPNDMQLTARQESKQNVYAVFQYFETAQCNKPAIQDICLSAQDFVASLRGRVLKKKKSQSKLQMTAKSRKSY